MGTLTFINHASYSIETKKTLLLVDPWVEGTAFDNGWALLDKSILNKQLVDYVVNVDKKTYIWLSHEHSDHFSVPFLKSLKQTNNLDVTFIFQKTLDGRVANFIRKLGFQVIESNDQLEILDSELSLVTFPYSGGDSYCLTILNDFTILNINDCVISNWSEADYVKKTYLKYTSNIDLLMTQFGYANWVGNITEKNLRVASAKEKLDRIVLQAVKFQPTTVIPFASFVYFSHPENFYMNDSQNSPLDVQDVFVKQKLKSELVVLKPWDTLELDQGLSLQKDSQLAIEHWIKCLDEIQPHPDVKIKYSLNEIKVEEQLYRKKIFRSFLTAPKLMEAVGILKPLKVYLTDLDQNLTLSYRRSLSDLVANRSDCDIALSSSTLMFILRNEYGANTTLVNGKFQKISKNGHEVFTRYFVPQEYMKMGYGLNHPFSTAKIIYGKLKNKLLGRLTVINPSLE